MRKATKIIISFAVVLIAGLNFIYPAFAQDPFTSIAIGGLTGASGAGLFGSMAGMSGIDIAWSQSGSDPMDAMWNVLNPDHVYFSGEKHEADPQSDPEDIYDYIQVDIGDWLQAQSDFIINFAQTYNVTDNSSGTVSGPLEYAGIPLTVQVGYNNYISGQVGTLGTFPFYVGNYGVEYSRETSSTIYYYTYYNGSRIGGENQIDKTDVGKPIYLQYSYPVVPGQMKFYYKIGNDWYGYGYPVTITLNSPVNTAWTSGVVNTSVFDGWESARVKIPKTVSQLQHDWTPVDFFNELDRIWSGAGEDSIIIEDGGDVPPVPPVPVPSTPLGDVPFDDWIDLWGQGIWQQLENQSDALDFIGSNGTDAIEELESIDENIGALEEAAESIDTNIGVGNGILGGIRSLAQDAVDYLEGIAEHVGELVEEIVAGTETLIAGILNQIPQAFGVIFGPIKQASSIWHYVVEWITSIGAPFQFIWSMASGTSYYVILPVYASLAAAVVLAFFKRFGR